MLMKLGRKTASQCTEEARAESRRVLKVEHGCRKTKQQELQVMVKQQKRCSGVSCCVPHLWLRCRGGPEVLGSNQSDGRRHCLGPPPNGDPIG